MVHAMEHLGRLLLIGDSGSLKVEAMRTLRMQDILVVV
jgi:hypothetical protein